MDYGTLMPLGACFLQSLTVHPSFRVFDFTGHPGLGLPARADALERAKRFLWDGLASNRFRAKVDRLFFGLKEYAAAHRYMESNAQVGKIVIALSS
jgi:NADPH:quinone reductase-like Zn-dependent oxidoreductase